MEPLLESFFAMKHEFAEDTRILSTIDQQINLAREWIAEKMNENPKEERPARRFGDVDSPEHPDAPARSVFDDIDD